MPYVDDSGVRIHYEVEGSGPPLVLLHGLEMNVSFWRLQGYVGALKDDYRLILVDARGHGDSEKLHSTQAYGAEQMTGDIVRVLDDLGVERVNYWGYSMGAKIGFELPQRHPSRFTSYILGGLSPYPPSDAGKRFEAGLKRLLLLGAEKGPRAVVSLDEKSVGSLMTTEIRKHLLDNDYKALYALSQNMFSWPATGGLLPTITAPCLLYAGERDVGYEGVKEAAKHIQHAAFVPVPGATHTEAFMLSSLIMPHAKRFLRDTTASYAISGGG